mgnify:CR=1 FL=1
MRRKEKEEEEVHMFMCAPSTAAATFASFDDDEYKNNSVIKDSETTVLQTELEETVREMYLKNDEEEEGFVDDCARRTSPTTSSSTTKRTFNLKRKKHVESCVRYVSEVQPTYVSVISSRTWIVYWLVHSLGVLGELDLDEDLQTDVVEFLASCQHESGGFGGGPGQLAHLAPTYAAMSALVTIGTKEAMAVADVGKLRAWLMRLKTVTTTTRCVSPMTTTMHFEKKLKKKKNFEDATRAKREKRTQCAYITQQKRYVFRGFWGCVWI